MPVFFGYSAEKNIHKPQKFLGWIRSDDFHRYGSFIDQTRYENRFLYWDYSATEPQSPRMIASYFFVLGLLGKLTGLPAQHLWFASALVVSWLFILILYKFLSIFAVSTNRKLIVPALGLILFSGGLEFFSQQAGVKFPRPKNFWMDGFSTFCSFHNPLKIAGIGSVLLMLLFWKTYHDSGKRLYAVATAVMIAAAWSIHPNSAIPGYVGLLAGILSRMKSEQRAWFNPKKIVDIIPLVISLAMVGLYVVWMKTDQTTANIIRQYQISFLVEPFRFYPIRYGVILPLGIIGLVRSIRKADSLVIMLIGWWIGAEAFAHFSGMSGLLFQHMVHLPMACFAAICLHDLLKHATPNRKRAVWVFLFITFSVQNVWIISKVIQQTRNDVWPTSLYWTPGEISASTILREYPKGNVLTSRASGNKVGWLSLKTVFLGHWGTTPQKGLKEKELKQFFNQDTPTSWRREFLNRYDIRYVWYGPEEKKLGEIDVNLPIEGRIDNSFVTVYEVINPLQTSSCFSPR